MRWTEFFIPTTKEVPKDAVVPSHQLMLRAGLIRQLAAGVYSYLPLGYRALRKVEAIVREEMNRAGAIELHMPVLHPIALWQETGRVAAMGDTLLKLRPVKEGDEGDWRAQTVLGPTHEEPITEIARAYLNSYKLLPINLYQIQVKFRGEARPKSGVLRTREFLMKDAYSFHRDKESLDEGYKKMYDAYCRIFARCGLPYIAVEAESGPIGGDASHEFMVRTDAGEDVLVRCASCGYAANTERAVPAAIAQDESAMQELKEVHTPGQRTIDEVSAFWGMKPAQMVKTLIYEGTSNEAKSAKRAGPSPAPAIFVVLVRGDHEVNDNKLNRIAGMKLELAPEATIQRLTGAPVGFAGPHTLSKSGVPYHLLVDQAVTVMRNAASGANKADYHVTGLNPGRDFPLGDSSQSRDRQGAGTVPDEGRSENQTGLDNGRSPLPHGRGSENAVVVADIRTVAPGDRCEKCGGELVFEKCIEIGHVFKLGTKYSDAMKATFLDNDGKPKPLIMGCYGIGLNRIMAAAIEAHHDENGILWPASIAPFEVLIVALDPREKEVMDTAAKIHDELAAAGVDVLLDDRDERAGFKFKDADLIGVPVRITVGRKGLAEGVVELKRRDSADIEKTLPTATTEKVLSHMNKLRQVDNRTSAW